MTRYSLLNRAAVRRYILERVRLTRPGWDCTAVSLASLDAADAKLRTWLDGMIHQHPSLGKTFRP